MLFILLVCTRICELVVFMSTQVARLTNFIAFFARFFLFFFYLFDPVTIGVNVDLLPDHKSLSIWT